MISCRYRANLAGTCVPIQWTVLQLLPLLRMLPLLLTSAECSWGRYRHVHPRWQISDARSHGRLLLVLPVVEQGRRGRQPTHTHHFRRHRWSGPVVRRRRRACCLVRPWWSDDYEVGADNLVDCFHCLCSGGLRAEDEDLPLDPWGSGEWISFCNSDLRRSSVGLNHPNCCS